MELALLEKAAQVVLEIVELALHRRTQAPVLVQVLVQELAPTHVQARILVVETRQSVELLEIVAHVQQEKYVQQESVSLLTQKIIIQTELKEMEKKQPQKLLNLTR